MKRNAWILFSKYIKIARKMRINQVFKKPVDLALTVDLLRCFALNGLDDTRLFCKKDLLKFGTLARVAELVPSLSLYYLPCKARTYLSDLSEKRVVTVLKQVVRLHGYILLSKERSVNGKKVIFYRLTAASEIQQLHHMTKAPLSDSVITFE